MSQISLKSISGITSITTPAGVDNQFTLHTNNTSQALKLDSAGNIHINNHVNTTGVTTATNFKTGSSNLHSAGVEVAGVNILGADTPIGTGATIYNSGAAVFTGVVTATQFKGDGDFVELDVDGHTNLDNVSIAGVVTATAYHGDGSNLTGLASREFYGFTGIGNSLSLTTTNSGADNIDGATYAAFEESFTGPSGISFSINTSGNLIMSV